MGFRLCQIWTWVYCYLQLWTSGSPSAVLAPLLPLCRNGTDWPLPRVVETEDETGSLDTHSAGTALDIGLWGATDLRKAECLYVRKKFGPTQLNNLAGYGIGWLSAPLGTWSTSRLSLRFTLWMKSVYTTNTVKNSTNFSFNLYSWFLRVLEVQV